eukprot:6005930-Prymnesium_polylepis.1
MPSLGQIAESSPLKIASRATREPCPSHKCNTKAKKGSMYFLHRRNLDHNGQAPMPGRRWPTAAACQSRGSQSRGAERASPFPSLEH